MTKPNTTEGIELPTQPGAWRRDVKPFKWKVVVWRSKSGDLAYSGYKQSYGCYPCPSAGGCVRDLPTGGWLPATPAPAVDVEGAAKACCEEAQRCYGYDEKPVLDCFTAILRKYSRSPSPDGELVGVVNVKGRTATVVTHPNLGAAITDGCFWLDEDGEWRIGTSWTEKYKFPNAEAAAAFLAQHADQPAAVSPAATARTFEDWRNDEADDATAATAEQGDESERIKIMAAGCAEALRIQQEIIARLRGKLPKPIVGSLETYLPPGFYVIATEDAGLFDHQIVSCTDIDSGAMTIGFTYYRIDDIIEAAEAELANLKRQVEAKGEQP